MLVGVLFEHTSKTILLLFVEWGHFKCTVWINLGLVDIEKLVSVHIYVEAIALKQICGSNRLACWESLLPHQLHLVYNNLFYPSCAVDWSNKHNKRLDRLQNYIVKSSVSRPKVDRYWTCI